MSTTSVIARGLTSRSNSSSRYLDQKQSAFDDGWRVDDLTPRQIPASVTTEHARKIISKNDSPDLGFDQTINPYRGCGHGCIYCCARPTHAYLDLSPGLDFDTRLFVKPDTAELLERELSHPSYQVKWIQLGASTDPYQPIERQFEVTRRVIEVLARFNHPFGITTKNAMVTRDIDLLTPNGATQAGGGRHLDHYAGP